MHAKACAYLLFANIISDWLVIIPIFQLCRTSKKYPKMNLVVFTRSFLQVISQSFFGNIWWNFSWNLLIWRIFYSWTKSWLKWPWNSVFLCKNGKMGFFWSELFFEPFFPMKLFTEGHKILHDGNCIELEVPFQIL